MVYPPDPDALWEPSDPDRELQVEDFTESVPPLSQQYVPVAPIAPAPVYEEDQPWEGVGPALRDLAPSQEEMQRYHSVGVLDGPDEFANKIASEFQELRKTEYDIGARAERGAKRLPFIGGFLSAGSMMGVYDAAERYNRGIYHEGDAKLLAAYMAEAERQEDLGIFDNFLEIALDMPGYAAEMYVTGGAATAGRTLVRKTLTEVAEKMVKRGVLKAIGKRGAARAAAAATRGAGEVAGIAVGGASMAAVSPWLLSEKTSEHAVRNLLNGDDEPFANALWQGPLSASITLGAEFAGGMTAKALSRMPGISKLKELVFHNLLDRPGATVQSLLRMKERIGWHGMLGELEEERLDELVHGLTGLSEDYGVIQGVFSDDPDRVKAAWSQLASESLAFGAFGAAFALPNASRYAKGMDTPRQRLEKFLNSQSRGNYNKLDPGIRQRLPNTVVIDGEEVDFDPSKGSHRAAVRPEAERMLQEVDAQVAAAPEEFKTQVAEVAQVVVAEGNAPGRSQEFKGLLTRLEMLLAEDNPGEAILREGITLEELNTIRVQVAGVPATESGQRRTPQQLLLEYPSAARNLSQASEVSNDEFKRLTGTALAEGEGSETITEYQDSLRAIVMGDAALGVQTAAEQVRAIGQAEGPGPSRERLSQVGMGGVAGMETMAPPVGQPAAAPVVEGPVAAEPVAAEAPTAADEEGAAAVEPAVGPKFQSGLTRSVKRMNQSIDANEPVGVTVLSVDSRSGKLRTISDTILDLLVEAADKGLRVFVDSGAFGLYRSGIDMPWDLVQQEYRRIRDAVPRQLHNKLYFVAPDVLGDLDASVEAISNNYWIWGDLLQDEFYVNRNINIIVPVPMEEGVSFRAAMGVIGGADIQWDNQNIVVGVPFNKAAWKEEDIVEFYQQEKETDPDDTGFPRIHLLGGGTTKVKSLAKKLNDIDPTITVTGDSTRREDIGKKLYGMDSDATVPIDATEDEAGAAARGGAPEEYGQQDIDTGPATAEFPTGEALELHGLELPELVELAQNLIDGQLPTMNTRLQKAAAIFKEATGQLTSAAIMMNPTYAKNRTEAAQILAHELGHLIDYLPEEALGEATLKRGNILGRIKKLNNYLKKYTDGPMGSLDQEEIKNELIELSEWWTPYDKDTATDRYKSYRNSNKELFAQALSVFLVAPKELKDRAPAFWRGFMAYISRHPEFLKEYQELQDLLAGDSEKLLEHRSERVLAGFQSSEEALLSVAAAREGARMSGWDTLVQFATQGILDRFAPGKKLAKRARDRGASVKESRNFEALLDELFTVDAPVHALVMRTQREIVEPLQAAGVSMDQFGEYTMMLRVIMERSEFFNPLGTTAETAAEAINQLQRNLSAEITHPINGSTMTQFELLEEMSLRWHREIVFPIVKNAVEAGVYNRDKVEGPGGLRENIDNYSTFLVLKYITTDERISPMLEKQVGTFGEIANPFNATMLKMVTLHRFNQINGTKKSIVEWMEKYFKEEFEELKPEPGPKGTLREPDPPQDPNRDILKVLRDGDMKYYSVDKAIVKMFLQHDIGTLQSISGLLSSQVYKRFHPLFVTYNPSFIAGNWLKDVQRTHRNLGAQSKRLEYETAQAHLQDIRDTHGREPNQIEVAQAEAMGRKMRIGLLDILKERHKLMGWGRVAQFLSGGALKAGPARQFARGQASEEVKKQIEEMMDEHAYAIPLTDIESQTGQMLPGFLEADLSPRERAAKEIKRLRELDDPSMLEKFKSKVLPAWGHMLHAFEVLGAERLKSYAEAQELAGKMTGYNLMKQRGVDTRQRALMTRKDTGTPDFMQRGLVTTLTNFMWMYSKVRWNSLHRDYQLLKGDQPKTRAAWIMHQVVWTLAPTTVVKMAGYGALGFLGPVGDELQEWYKLFSRYFVDNYDVIPLGTTQIDGKRHAVGLTIPRDETRSFLAQMWGNAMDAVVEATTDVETEAGTAPAALQDLLESIDTNMRPNLNPYIDIADAWRQYATGMNPRDRFYKGDIIPRSHWEAGGWESNRKMLAWTIKKTGIINTVVHPFTGPILGDAFDDTEEQFKTTTVLRSTPVLQRFLRVSQRGMQDRHWMAMENERADAAAFRLQLPKTVRNANGRQYLLSHTQHLLDEDGKQELMVLNKWRSMTYMPAREKMLEAAEAGDEQTVQQLREQLSVVTKSVMSNPVANVPDLYLGAIAWQLTNPSFEQPLKSDELKILQANGRGIREIESLIKQEALRRSNMEAERTQKRLGRPYRPRKVPRITKALGERLNNMRRIFSGREPRRRRIGRAGARR